VKEETGCSSETLMIYIMSRRCYAKKNPQQIRRPADELSFKNAVSTAEIFLQVARAWEEVATTYRILLTFACSHERKPHSSIFVGCILLRNVHVRIFSDIYPQSQLRTLLMLLYLSVSQHVSAPTTFYIIRDKFMNNGSVVITMVFSKFF
jgi:hypothetical protein